MERRNVTNLSDISSSTPNLVFDAGTGGTGGATNAQIFIRGVGQTDFLFTSDPGVGLYVDDVYLPRAVGAVMEIADFERVEVLRGPQGTLFGKNTIGGAINIVTKRPGRDFGGMIEAIVGSSDRTDARAAVDLPVNDDLSLRVSAIRRKQDGYVERIVAKDGALGNVDMSAARLQALWTPSADWEVSLSVDAVRRRERSIANELADVRDPADNPPMMLWNMLVAPSLGPDVVYDGRFVGPKNATQGTGPTYSDLDALGASIIVQRDFGSATLKSITAYREQKADFAQDQDHSPLRFTQTMNDNDQSNFSQELQLSGNSFDDRLKWVGGLFFFREDGRDFFDVLFVDGLYEALEALPDAIIPLGAGVTCPPPPGVMMPCAGGAGNPLNAALDYDARFYNDIEIASYAAYTQGTFQLTDQFSITAGLRYTYEEKRLDSSMYRNRAGVYSYPPQHLERDWKSWSPRLGVEYRFSPDVLAYVSASRGFKSGGFNGRATSVAEIDSYDPEIVWTYETGFKSEWFQNRIRLNGAVYYSNYTDMQLFSLRNDGGLIIAKTENAGKSRIQGFELETAMQLTDQLLFTGGVGYTDAEYRKLGPGASVTLDTKFPKTPEWMWSGALQYNINVAAGTWSLSSDVSHRSTYFNDVPNTDIGRQDGVTLLGARLGFEAASGRWRAAVFGTNLTDKRYIINSLNQFGSLGNGDATYARGREWGVSLKYTF
jgi:iron complex outermembrane receptor protein